MLLSPLQLDQLVSHNLICFKHHTNKAFVYDSYYFRTINKLCFENHFVGFVETSFNAASCDCFMQRKINYHNDYCVISQLKNLIYFNTLILSLFVKFSQTTICFSLVLHFACQECIFLYTSIQIYFNFFLTLIFILDGISWQMIFKYNSSNVDKNNSSENKSLTK